LTTYGAFVDVDLVNEELSIRSLVSDGENNYYKMNLKK
jgi:hypothetical protein